MRKRKASVKETGEELSPETWERFEAAAEKTAKEPPEQKAKDQTAALAKPTDEESAQPD